MTDADIDAAARADPDTQPLSEAELAQGFRPHSLRELRDR